MVLEELDAKGMDVFEAIHEAGGRASTGEVSEITGIEKNAIILYRFDKLEEKGVIETEQGEPTGDRLPPRIAEVTEKGEELIRGGLFAEEEPTVVERMDRLERQFKQVTEELQELRSELRDFRYDPESDEERDLVELAERVEGYRERLEEMEDVAEIDASDVRSLKGRQEEIVGALETVHGQLYEVAEALHYQEIEPEGSWGDQETFAALETDPVTKLHESRR